MTHVRLWPESVEEAIELLHRLVGAEQGNRLATVPEQDLVFEHLGLALAIRQAFGLWEGNVKLMENCAKAMGYLGKRTADLPHPDDVSMYLLRRLWQRLRAEAPAPGYSPLH
jgi:uncharacterized protein DUF6794